jgi:hypothetical protein
LFIITQIIGEVCKAFGEVTKQMSTTSIRVKLPALRGYVPSNPGRILCIGKDSGLLRSRCAVLRHAGYDAQATMYNDAEGLLRNEEFDLIILSAILSDEEKDHISAVVNGGTPILPLKKLIFASELLAEVEQRIRSAKRDFVA